MDNDYRLVQPDELSVLNVFSGVEYIVPIYQRNYSWEEKEIVQLLDDINDSSGNYYLGSLIVNQRSVNLYEVVDGQQRLTTLYLLLAFINPDFVKGNSFRFEAREKSNRTLAEIRYLSDVSSQEKELLSEEIINGFAVIKKYFEKKQNKDDFVSRLDKVKLLRIQVPHGVDLNHYFEVMNTRGEQLELHEIVKGKILKVITNPEDRLLAAKIWDNCAQMDRYVQMNFEKDAREKLFGKGWNEFQYNQFDEIKSMLRDNNCYSSYSLLSKLENPEMEKDTNNSKKSDSNKDEEKERFESIVTFPVFLLLVNEAINSSDNEDDSSLDDKKFIELMEDHFSSNDKALRFVFNLLKYRFLFDKYIIKREYAKDYKKEGRWSLQRLEKYNDTKGGNPIYKGTYNTQDGDDADDTKTLRWLQSCIRILYNSHKPMHSISKALSFVSAADDSKKLTFLLEKYCCDKIRESDYKNKRGFGIDRIVFTYLDYVLCRDDKSNNNYQFQFRTSIEHFYPQHPINNIKWKEDDLNCLGNLALITVSSNSKFSNLLPHQKAEDYPDHINQSPKLQMMCKLMKENKNIWEEEIAQKHNAAMLRVLEEEINNH